MVEWATVIILILLGLFLVWAEIVFMPGLILTAIFGLAATTGGVYYGYIYFGTQVGNWILIVAILLNLLNLYFIFRGRSWDAFSLKETHTTKVKDNKQGDVSVGDLGKALSVLRPIGKAEFGDQVLEVTSSGEFIEENSDIKIIRIESNKIVVTKK